MIPPQRNSLRPLTTTQSGLTVTEVIACLGLLAIVVALAIPSFPFCGMEGNRASQLNNGKQIYYALRSYASDSAHESAFPTFADPKAKSGLFANSNEAFTSLLPRYLNDKKVFNNKQSAWCKTTTKTETTANTVPPGENDWCYMRGLKDSSDPRCPLLANAFAPGSTHYVKDPSKPGGVLKGADAIVIWVGGSAGIVETRAQGDHFIVPRPGKPTANAFEKDGEWLAGENVQLLYPDPEPR